MQRLIFGANGGSALRGTDNNAFDIHEVEFKQFLPAAGAKDFDAVDDVDCDVDG